MIEPEVAFNDIKDNMDLGEECLKYCIEYVMKHAESDLQFLHEREINEDKQKPMQERQTSPLLDRLRHIHENEFVLSLIHI